MTATSAPPAAPLVDAAAVDVFDMEPGVGAYVSIKEMRPYDVYGDRVDGFTLEHAYHTYIRRRWDCRCDRCGHHLRYVCVVEDTAGGLHCFGLDCVQIATKGSDRARKLTYARRAENKAGKGWCATFEVPPAFWDLPRDARPAGARVWKGEGRTRSGRATGRPRWKLSVWGDTLEACVANCMAVDAACGVKLC